MSDNDEIKPGDRFERVGPGGWGVSRGDIYTALRPAITVTGGWFVEGSEVIWYLGVTRHWRRLPRTDAAPSVKVSDIVRDPALLAAGMEVCWTDMDSRYSFTLHNSFGTDPGQAALIKSVGVVLVALPEPTKPSVKDEQIKDIALIIHEHGKRLGRALVPVASNPTKAEAPSCKPGCTPAAPCRTEGVCHAWRELRVSKLMGLRAVKEADGKTPRFGISPDALPPARAATYQPRCAELSGWGSWNGRARK